MEAPVYLFDYMRDVVNGINLFFAKNPNATPGVIVTDYPDQRVSVRHGKTSTVTVQEWTSNILPTEDGTYQLKGFNSITPVNLGNLIVRNNDIITCKNGVCSYGNACTYMYSHPVEMAETLTELSKSPATNGLRYPLIAVLTDVIVNRDKQEYYGRTSLRVLIATESNKNYRADEREELSFKPVLLPLYYQFLEQIRKCGHFVINYDEGIPHEYTKRLYWGHNGLFGQSTDIDFKDYVDCIEITNLQLTIKNPINERTT